jgi:hypothetical protein
MKINFWYETTLKEEYLEVSIATLEAKAQHISMKTQMVNQCGVLT